MICSFLPLSLLRHYRFDVYIKYGDGKLCFFVVIELKHNASSYVFYYYAL